MTHPPGETREDELTDMLALTRLEAWTRKESMYGISSNSLQADVLTLVAMVRRALGEPRESPAPQETVSPEGAIRASVVYRTGPLTFGDYTEAIDALIDGRGQLQPDGRNCAVCHDSDHQAWQCRHNPMVLARRYVALMGDFTVYRCFHCGEAFTGDAAREHFGKDEEEVVRCLANRAVIAQIPLSGRVSPAQPSEEQGERSAAGLLEILDNMLEDGALIELRHVEGVYYALNLKAGEAMETFGVFGVSSLRAAINELIDRDVVDETGEGGFDRGEPAEPITDLMAALKASLAKRSVAGSSPAPEEQT